MSESRIKPGKPPRRRVSLDLLPGDDYRVECHVDGKVSVNPITHEQAVALAEIEEAAMREEEG